MTTETPRPTPNDTAETRETRPDLRPDPGEPWARIFSPPPGRWLILAALLLAVTASSTLANRLLETPWSRDPLTLELRADLDSMRDFGLPALAAAGPPAGVLGVADDDLRNLDLEGLYGRRDFRPLWWNHGVLHSRSERLLELFDYCPGLSRDGSPVPADRLRATLRWSPIAQVSRATQVRWELALTSAMVRCAEEMGARGADLALQAGWDLGTEEPEAPLGEVIGTIAADEDPDAFADRLTDLAAPHPQVRALGAAIRQYREIVRAGGWPTLPADASVAPGEPADPMTLQVLARRLAIEGFLAEEDLATARGPRPSPELVDAIRRFQAARGLEADGVVGQRTLAALDVPAAERLRQLELNLVRSRWLPAPPAGPNVFVNVAAYRLEAEGRGGRTTTRVVVGQRDWPTPVLRDEIEYFVVHPAWHVPDSIARAEVVPSLLRDPVAAAEQGFVVYDGPDRTRTIDPAELPERLRSSPELPRIVQLPGPANPLGRIKLIFPNPHNVYLHDTAAPQLFAKTDRALSHGCVRVQDPLGVVETLFGPDQGARVRAAVDAGERRVVRLEKPVPVLLAYFTAWVRDDGTVEFFDDPYDRDEELALALGTTPLPAASGLRT